MLAEQFAIAGPFLIRRHDEDNSARSLQSPDDPEATYRTHGREGHRGYVANLTETCDPDNAAQLIVHVAVEPKCANDAAMLVEAIPQLVATTEVHELYTDGGCNSPAVGGALREHSVEQFQTAIRGRSPKGQQLRREDFLLTEPDEGRQALARWSVDDVAHPTAVTCPNGSRARSRTPRERDSSQSSRTPPAKSARFTASVP